MTLPVFSEREVRNIRATKKVCTRCEGLRVVVVNQLSNLYRCGYVTFAETCPLCQGYGLITAITMEDRLMAAAGDKGAQA